MDVKEEKPMEKTIPVFTVLKKGAILMVLFVTNSRSEEEQILQVGRHPCCDIPLTHRSISSYHMQIRSLPSDQKLFVTDLSSRHGTWVRDHKVEPDACVEVKEGDVIRIGCSTRQYRLNWIPVSLAYAKDNLLLDRMIEAHNQKSQTDTADGHLDVTYGSSVSSDDEDTRDLSLPDEDFHTLSKVKNEPLTPKKKSPASARNTISNLIFLDLCVHLIITISVTVFYKIKWTIVLDTSSLLDKESRQPLHLLQGLKGTHLVVPRTVLRELNDTKSTWSLLFRRRAEIASSALDWIQECIVDTKWWIQLQSLSEETKATPQSNGSTSEDQVLECALLYRNRNISEKLVLLSNDVTLKIKAMAEVKSMNKIRCLIVELHLSSN
ncbi:PREDICTED: FHA domain-containing protein PS1-like isoform X1 [Brassica oleracea var. oleracea]|uniref:FHA domain-containing protein PS1-like isoform X1 n=1 Tax=Brassica oleracea var. oleracea TaxID=109376 RepID=UPI0006A73062|nr:PREDICTED: FHA domain-containing protein PS1-like isoform X1 [Brassica oleracea var. oleracea]